MSSGERAVSRVYANHHGSMYSNLYKAILLFKLRTSYKAQQLDNRGIKRHKYIPAESCTSQLRLGAAFGNGRMEISHRSHYL